MKSNIWQRLRSGIEAEGNGEIKVVSDHCPLEKEQEKIKFFVATFSKCKTIVINIILK